jgi:hypothetical protein
MKKILSALMFVLMSFNANSALTDIKFGRYQIADSQWNVNACLNTTTCQIYSKNPGTMYKIPWFNGQWSWQTGQYVQFALSGNASYPYEGKVYNSNGTLAGTIGTGKIVNMGSDYFFFVGNDNNTGQLFSGSSGMSNTSGVTWTGTLNPTISQADAIANASYSTEPLAPGATATTTPSSGGGGGSVAPVWPETSAITVDQSTKKSQAGTRTSAVTQGNKLYLEQRSGSSNNTVNIEQTGFYNGIGGLGGAQYAVIDGQSNTVNIKQGDTLGKNLVEFSVVGNLNTVTLWQARSLTTGLQDGSESGGHYVGVNVAGNSNTMSVKQGNNGGASSGHLAFVDVAGNGNTGSLRQSNNGEKVFFGVVTGSNTVFEVLQQGTVAQYFDLMLSGNGHSVTANQKDGGAHKATVNLTNAGGASTVTLVQQGSTAQNINITQQCATLSGCSVNITQGQ